MDGALIGSIVNAVAGTVTGLGTAFIGYGAGVYAVNHTPMPVADQYSYNIVVPEAQQATIFTPGIIALFAIMLLMMIIGAYVLIKIS